MNSLLKTFLILLFTLSIGACNPFKVTDPSNPNFDPYKFSFSDYFDNNETVDAFRKLFPVGTSKEFVDRVLVDAGKATASQIKALPQVWRYDVPGRTGYPAGPVHIFIFSDSNTVENIAVSAVLYVYADRTTLKYLRENRKGK